MLASPRSTQSELELSDMKSDKGGVTGLLPEIFPQLNDLPRPELFFFLSVFKAPVSFLKRDIIHDPGLVSCYILHLT